MLNRSILDAQLDAGRSVESSPKDFDEHFGHRRAKLRHFLLIGRRFALRNHGPENTRRAHDFQAEFLATVKNITRQRFHHGGTEDTEKKSL